MGAFGTLQLVQLGSLPDQIFQVDHALRPLNVAILFAFLHFWGSFVFPFISDWRTVALLHGSGQAIFFRLGSERWFYSNPFCGRKGNPQEPLNMSGSLSKRQPFWVRKGKRTCCRFQAGSMWLWVQNRYPRLLALVKETKDELTVKQMDQCPFLRFTCAFCSQGLPQSKLRQQGMTFGWTSGDSYPPLLM